MKLIHQMLLLGLMVVLLAVTAGLGWRIIENRKQVEQLDRRLTEAKIELEKVQAELKRRENFLKLIETDPEMVARLARDHLGYVRPDELIVRPEEPAPKPRTTAPALR
jgi:cell division protein FtsB